MNANALNFDLFALAQPKSRDDLIALAKEARFELSRINSYFESLYDAVECPSEA